ncbi:MAG: RNA-guided endonuclease InsQ/TnpB family protein [Chroococcales cyanobacterium]
MRQVNDKTPEKLTNQKAVQSLIYKEARAHSGLSAQMTIHAIAVLACRCGRRRHARIAIESEPPAIPDTDDVLGIDLGRTNITCTSKGEKFSGQLFTQTRDRYSRVRDSLQKKASIGARSTRRRARQILLPLSGRERRFQTWLNHTISYRLTRTAKASNQAIALEDLTGIRERTNELPRSKTERRRSNSYSFYQLRQFLIYKGVKFGVDVRIVDPRYTSKTCHGCKVIGNRQGKKFECLNLKCGWVGDADENEANNIATLGAQLWGLL